MKFIIGVLGLTASLLSFSSPANADCKMDAMSRCYEIEKNRPNSSRGGASDTEFCAAQAIVECTHQPNNQNHGYDDTTADWLKNQNINPSEARAIEDACGSACQ